MNRLFGFSTRGVLVVVPVVFIGTFFLYPIATILWRGLGGGGGETFLDLAASSRQRDIAWFTIWQAIASTVLTLAVGIPAASVVARLTARRQRLVRALVTVPFVLPTVVVAAAFTEVFSVIGLDDGAFRFRHTVWAILIAHVFFNYAVVVRAVGSYWASLDHRMEEAARALGARPWQAFREVTLPRLRPAVAAAAAIVFLFSFTSFGVVLILGGPRRATIETEIYRQAVTRVDLETAAALAALQLVAVLTLVVLSTRLERRRLIVGRGARSSRRPASLGWRGGNLAIGLVLLGGPIGVLVERSFSTGGGYGLDHYEALGERARQLPAPATTALWNSVVFALAATAIAVLVGLLASLVVVHGRRGVARIFDLGLTLPLGTSAVTIGFGMLIALDEPPLDLRTSWWIIPIAHALVGVPFVVRTMVPVLRSIDPVLHEAAAVLGASPARARREVDVPIGMRGLVVGAGFAFAVSLGEFGATSFLPRRPENLTAPIALFRLLSTPGDLLQGQAMALSVILMVLVATAVLVIESGRRGNEGVL